MPTFRRTLAATFAAIVAALLIALAPAATAKPKPPQPPPLPERQLDPGTERDPVFKKMLAYREWYRTTFRISPGSNVAVFHFKYPNGAEGYWAIHSDPGKNTPDAPTGHSEKRAMRIMRSLGIDTNTVDKMLSELETCNLPGRKCKSMVAREFRNATVGHLNPYPDDAGGAQGEHEGAQGGEPADRAPVRPGQADHEPGRRPPGRRLAAAGAGHASPRRDRLLVAGAALRVGQGRRRRA